MESSLTLFNNPIPIKAIPEKDLNGLIMGSFLDWISATLSLNEDGANKLKYALPAIKEHCWSMGFPEIKKMIEMYADGKLSVKPIPNHFDRIKFGEVANAYREQKPRKKPKPMPEPTDEEKELRVYEGVINCFEQWKQDECIINGYAWVEKHLRDLGLIEFTDQESKYMWLQAKHNLLAQSKSMSYEKAKDLVRELEGKSGKRRTEYQLIRLDKYFSKIKRKGKHIKDYI